jgi:hypothetical protein
VTGISTGADRVSALILAPRPGLRFNEALVFKPGCPTANVAWFVSSWAQRAYIIGLRSWK